MANQFIVTVSQPMSREEFLKLLAAFIANEAYFNPNDSTPEPYRAAGDRLVDDALPYIDDVMLGVSK